MKQFKWLLLPFSLIYGFAVVLRNKLFDLKLKESYPIPKKSIVVGNLSVGGTGKTPLVKYIVEHFYSKDIKTATISRGYGRKSKGVVFASSQSTAQEIGDEPLIYASSFKHRVEVVVAEKRKEGIEQLLQKRPDTELIVLDDAFQHRAVTAGFNIIVTEFKRPFTNDFILPVGRLREPKNGAARADLILISKCPNSATQQEKEHLRDQCKKFSKHVFFSGIQYGQMVSINRQPIDSIKNILLVTGIGNPKPLVEHLESSFAVSHIKFPDHHDFTVNDIEKIHQKFNTFASHDKIIVTTEKDFMRLREFEGVTSGNIPWFYQPIELSIDNEEQFKNLLDIYVREN